MVNYHAKFRTDMSDLSEPSSSHSKQATVLVVDDIPENLQVLSQTLEQQGWEVCIANSGTIALTRITDIMPDLVLLDIHMPGLNGYEVCAQIKANPRVQHIPVIFISAINDVLDKVKAFQVGGADYITKPFQLDETLARINHQLKLAVLQHELEQQSLALQTEIQERKQVENLLAQLNADLEQQVETRTAQLQLAYNFEATLKRITDRVRDSLDEHQVIQAAVEELARAVGATGCNAALYDLNQQISTVRYEYTDSLSSFQGRVLQMRNAAEIYAQLLQGQSFQFCSLAPHPERGQATLMACPIIENAHVIGDLWLIRQSEKTFNEQEIRLVQQVANQCVIALRQARLYQAAQAQVEELERLNRLKDDFLNTVSHELRTPMASIKMATHLLEASLHAIPFPDKTPSPLKYLKVLREECEREISLINDLLDLSHLDAGSEPLLISHIHLHLWIPCVAEAFLERTRLQHQALRWHIPADLPPCTTDFTHLEGILRELLNNACKYTPAHETILITATTQPDAGELQIKVSNSGIEIPTSELGRIFDRFYRIPNNDPWKYGGTGLGLALVKKRVELIQGRIGVTSSGGWTTFTVALPSGEGIGVSPP